MNSLRKKPRSYPSNSTKKSPCGSARKVSQALGFHRLSLRNSSSNSFRDSHRICPKNSLEASTGIRTEIHLEIPSGFILGILPGISLRIFPEIPLEIPLGILPGNLWKFGQELTCKSCQEFCKEFSQNSSRNSPSI